jgi:serine protease AprX
MAEDNGEQAPASGGQGEAEPSPKRPAEPFSIPPALVDHILLGPMHDRGVLQDSPILGDVWLAYAADPASVQDLLITPQGRDRSRRCSRGL